MASSDAPNSGDSGQGLPPFIPGLLIVSLLIVMSILVAWRNYLRRNRIQTHVDALGTEWPIRWDVGNGLVGGQIRGPVRGKKLEKPEMWEIDVSQSKDPMTMKGLQWDDMMPLSITPLDPDLSIDSIQGIKPPFITPAETTPAPSYHNSRSTSSLRFLPRLPFLSRRNSMQTPDVPSRPDHVDSSSLFTKATSSQPALVNPKSNDLQISVMISMPDPYSRVYYRDDGSYSAVKPISDKSPAPTSDYEGVPNVAFGIAVVPLSPIESLSMNDKEK